MKKYLLITIFLSLTILTIALVLNYRFRLNFLYSLGLSRNSYCDFEIKDIKEYDFEKGKIQNLRKKLQEVDNNQFLNNNSNKSYELLTKYNVFSGNYKDYLKRNIESEIGYLENGRRIYYEAYLQNNSSYTQKLKAILGKTITNEGIVLEEGYTENKVTLSPGESTKIKFQIDYNDTETIKNYIETDDKKYDIKFYPWFETCEY